VFTEILKIKPVLDDSTAKQMEVSLHARFARVAGRFGSGLKAVVKGSILGISLGLLNKILNPIEELDTKIKALLGHGTDVAELADRLGAPAGEVEQLRNVAESFGVKPDKFNEAIVHFADAVEKAREELANPFQDKSPSTLVLAQFAKETNLVKSFRDFATSLQKTAQGPGTYQPLTAHASTMIAKANANNTQLTQEEIDQLLKAGELRKRTGIETAIAEQKDVFGAQQFGAMRKLLEANVDQQAKILGQPSVTTLTAANEKLAALEAQKLVLDVQNKTKDFIEATKKINGDMIQAMAAAEARSEAETTERLSSYQNLKKGADAVADIQQGFSKLLDTISVGLGYLKTITSVIPKIEQSSMVKGFLKTIGKGN
jgi:uncharacterized protein YbjQ (UPF0145 family)